MKKVILVALCVAALRAYALPTYEPFTEFNSLCTNGFVATSNGLPLTTAQASGSVSNAVDLATNGLHAPGGETWTAFYYNSTNYESGTPPSGTNLVHGLDVYVISNTSIFTYANVSSLLPATFPGCPASGQSITNFVENPAQPSIYTNGAHPAYSVEPYVIGNSAVLTFGQDITRPMTGTKTLFISYLFVDWQLGQTATGNDGRYLAFLASSNLVEGAGTTGYYTNWDFIFNSFTPTNSRYFGHGILEDNGTTLYLGPCDNSAGKYFATSPFTMPLATPVFVVGEYIMVSQSATNSGIKDTNIMWVNPSTSGFGGSTPPSSPIAVSTITNMTSDVGGMVLIDRPGSGASGGVGTNYIANLMLGSTWSYVTGGPEFTTQPASNTLVSPGVNVSLSGAAVAASQSVSYQWQINGVNVNNGANGTGGGATVSGATSPSLTLAGVSGGDSGTYVLVATASGTSFNLGSSDAVVTVSDPGILTPPQPTTVNYHGTASFTATAVTTTAKLTYAWYNGSTMLVNGLQADGSTVTGAQGTNTGGPITANLTLTLANVTCAESGNYSLAVTNAANNTVSSIAASLTVNDPYIGVQPPATVDMSPVTSGVIPVTAQGTGVSYAWQWNNGNGANINNGEIFGANTSALTISSASATSSDAGTYYVIVSGTGCAGSVTSSNTIVYFDAPVTAVTTSPATLTQQTGTHLAFVGTTTSGTQGTINYQWQHNGANLANGIQADGSWVSGAAGTSLGAGAETLVLSNIQVLDSGTYRLIAYDTASTNTATSTLTVSSNLLPLSTANLEVTRVGEGSEVLSGATGNTLYLDQFTTNGLYVSTIMVPDSGPSKLIVPGGAPTSGLDDSFNESYLTLSSNNDYLNFIGYFWSYPYTGGPSVTVGSASFAYPRSIGAVNGLGYYVLAYTNGGICSGGNAFVRCAYSTDGLLNFWVAGAAGSGSIKYVNTGPAGASYVTGGGIPALSTSTNGPRCLGLVGTNLVFSENGGLPGTADPTILLGLEQFTGAPENTPDPTSEIMSGGISHPADFAFSPDGTTVYIADDDATSGASGNGGIQRWDLESGTWQYSYNLYDGTGIGTNGMRGLAVNFSANATWGQGVVGAVLYATTSEVVSNRLIQIIDNGAGSPSTLLDTAGPNQFFRGVRFGPASLPVLIVTAPQSENTYVGQSDTLTVSLSGDAPFFYQWQFDGTNIAGATGSSLVLTNLQTTNSGTYSVIVSNPITAPITNSAVVSISAGPPVLLAGPQSRVETVGDHLAFTVLLTGSEPLYYQWSSNGVPVAGATNTSFSLTNITVANSGTYSVTYSNMFGTNTASATLLVTTNYQSLSSNNLVVARVGDGVQALSDTTGNTLYLDQITPAGVYSNTIMIPDNSPATDLIVSGGPISGLNESVLTLSASNIFLNFCGYNTNYPNTSSPPFVTAFSSPVPGDVFRTIGNVNAFGYYTSPQINETAYAVSPYGIESAVSRDGYAEFWATGDASAGGLKYLVQATAGSGGGNVGIAGSGLGTRVANIVAGNVVYSDNQVSPAGIWAFSGEPTAGATPANVLADAAGNANDFAASPDTTGFPPTTSTIYVGDSSSIAGGGGVQRYDWNGSAYTLSYTLGTGTGSTSGASCLTVDFSANTTWGPGATGAKIYATTAVGSSNQLIKIVDTGATSSATVLLQANANELLRGVRFGPVASVPIIVSNPQSQSVAQGGTTNFTTSAQNGPLTYQWQLNGANLTNGPSISRSGATITGAQTTNLTVANVGSSDNAGSYTVVVSNPHGPATSIAAVLTVLAPPAPPQFATNGAGPLTVTGPGSGTLNFSGTAGGTYHVWSTTNVGLTPIDSTWTLLGTGTFSGGADHFAITVTATNEFYVLTQP
jgi:hypothetical protein